MLALLLLAFFQQPLGTFCDAHQGACPCGDSTSTVETGCPNSYTPWGASLHFAWQGSWCMYASQSYGPYQILINNLPPNAPAMIVQGDAVHAPVVFGEGMRCVGGSLIRIGVAHTYGGPSVWGAVYPGPNDPSIAERAALPVDGGVRYYQGWYRAALGVCTPSTFNMTNGWGVSWGY